MKLLIFGASGGTGRELVSQALARGHEVTAFVRNPVAFDLRSNRLSTIRGNIEEPATIEQAIPSHDAVLSALGVNITRPNTILSDGTRSIVEAMERSGIDRLVCESSLGVGDSKGQLGPFYNLILLPLLLKHLFRDKERQEQLIRSSSLRWTIVRPGALTTGPATGSYHTGGQPGRRAPRVSRADVAEFMLDLVEGDRHVHEAVGIWNG